jgi:WD40 repeat protein
MEGATIAVNCFKIKEFYGCIAALLCWKGLYGNLDWERVHELLKEELTKLSIDILRTGQVSLSLMSSIFMHCFRSLQSVHFAEPTSEILVNINNLFKIIALCASRVYKEERQFARKLFALKLKLLSTLVWSGFFNSQNCIESVQVYCGEISNELMSFPEVQSVLQVEVRGKSLLQQAFGLKKATMRMSCLGEVNVVRCFLRQFVLKDYPIFIKRERTPLELPAPLHRIVKPLQLKGYVYKTIRTMVPCQNNAIITGSLFGSCAYWDTNCYTSRKVFPSGTRLPGICHIAVDGFHLYVGTHYEISVWNWLSGVEIRKFDCHPTKAVILLGLVATGGKIFSACSNASIKVWSSTTFEQLTTLSTDTSRVVSLCSCGHMLYAAVNTGRNKTQIRMWNIRTLDELPPVEGQAGRLTCVVATEKWVYAASENGTINAWEWAQEQPPLSHPNGALTCTTAISARIPSSCYSSSSHSSGHLSGDHVLQGLQIASQSEPVPVRSYADEQGSPTPATLPPMPLVHPMPPMPPMHPVVSPVSASASTAATALTPQKAFEALSAIAAVVNSQQQPTTPRLITAPDGSFSAPMSVPITATTTALPVSSLDIYTCSTNTSTSTRISNSNSNSSGPGEGACVGAGAGPGAGTAAYPTDMEWEAVGAWTEAGPGTKNIIPSAPTALTPPTPPPPPPASASASASAASTAPSGTTVPSFPNASFTTNVAAPTTTLTNSATTAAPLVLTARHSQRIHETQVVAMAVGVGRLFSASKRSEFIVVWDAHSLQPVETIPVHIPAVAPMIRDQDCVSAMVVADGRLYTSYQSKGTVFVNLC